MLDVKRAIASNTPTQDQWADLYESTYGED